MKIHKQRMINMSDIKPYANNARTHSTQQIEQIVKSIKEFGFTNPLLIDNDCNLIAGHGRLEAIRWLNNFDYKDKPITQLPAVIVSDMSDTKQTIKERSLTLGYWKQAKQGEKIGKFESEKKLADNKPAPTLTTRLYYHSRIPRSLNQREFCLCGSYPLDYKFTGHSYNFYIGMSVPPIMIANIAYQIRLQWLDKL